MNEAARCDRISLMNAGHVLVTGTPAEIVKSRSAESLEEAFIAYLEDATGIKPSDRREVPHPTSDLAPVKPLSTPPTGFLNLRRMLAYTQREALELMRDPIRLALATVGSVLLMFVIGYGINLDVDNLSFAVLDFDDSRVSRDYALQIAGSRYFVEKAPITDYDDLDRRMRGGKLTLAIEIPPGFGRDLARGRNVQIAAWVDGAMPSRGEIVRGYVEENHVEWLGNKQRESAGMRAATRGAVIRGQMDPSEQARLSYGQRAATDKEPADAFGLQVRFRYNPGFESLVAMVPAVIALLLLIIPAMLSVLSVVREKELGSIINFYVTPVTRLEFLMGKQIPYVLLAMQNFLALTAFGVFVFRVPLTGSFLTLTAAALLYVVITTATGLVISAFTRSQIAAIFTTAIVTLIPAINYSGLVDPVSSLQGIGALIGNVFPTTFFMTITRGVFSKGLDFAALQHEFMPLFIAVPALMGLGVALLNKQER
jgi:ribosome-dependent ATPase